MIRPLRNKFIAFILALILAALAAHFAIDRFGNDRGTDAVVKSLMIGFDLAAFVFLFDCLRLLWMEPGEVADHAAANDANRTTMLLVTVVVSLAILGAVAMEALREVPGLKTKALILATLGTAWLFANTIYALHYAHLHAVRKGGIGFPGRDEPPGYADFVYFAFTLGMTFQTSDVEIRDRRIRNVVTMHCLAAFVFNLGVLAFTINVLGGG